MATRLTNPFSELSDRQIAEMTVEQYRAQVKQYMDWMKTHYPSATLYVPRQKTLEEIEKERQKSIHEAIHNKRYHDDDIPFLFGEEDTAEILAGRQALRNAAQ